MDLGPLDINMSVIYMHWNSDSDHIFIKCWKFWYDTLGNIMTFLVHSRTQKGTLHFTDSVAYQDPIQGWITEKAKPMKSYRYKAVLPLIVYLNVLYCCGSWPLSTPSLWSKDYQNHYSPFQEDSDRRFKVDGNPFACWLSISRSIKDFCLWYLFLFAASAENKK